MTYKAQLITEANPGLAWDIGVAKTLSGAVALCEAHPLEGTVADFQVSGIDSRANIRISLEELKSEEKVFAIFCRGSLALSFEKLSDAIQAAQASFSCFELDIMSYERKNGRKKLIATDLQSL